MKKTILAIAIPALFASAANATVVYDKDGTTFDIYGRVQANYFGDTNEWDKATNTTTSKDSELIGSSRFGWSGKIALNDTWSGIAKTEWQVAAENSDNNKFKARKIYAGFDGSQYGQIIFGQTDTAYYAAIARTDIAFENGFDGAFYDSRQEGQMIYSGKWGGFSAAASYQSADSTKNIDHGFAGSLGYDFDFGLGLGVGGERKDFDATASTDKTNKDDVGGSISYSINGFYLAGMYSQSKTEYADGQELKGRGFDLFGTYTVDAWVFETGYTFKEETNKGSSDYTDSAEWTYVGAQYNFTPKLNAYTEYRISGISAKDDEWTVALQYNF